jgi:hypothetical protein
MAIKNIIATVALAGLATLVTAGCNVEVKSCNDSKNTSLEYCVDGFARAGDYGSADAGSRDSGATGRDAGSDPKPDVDVDSGLDVGYSDTGNTDAGGPSEGEGEGEGPNPLCEDGDTRLYGNQKGVCDLAMEVCRDETWNLIQPDNYGAEVCDALDNDCDEKIDEDLNAPAYDGSQEGVCAGLLQVCTGAAGWENPVVPGYEENEVSCDNADNDCDGEIDEQNERGHDICAERCPIEDIVVKYTADEFDAEDPNRNESNIAYDASGNGRNAILQGVRRVEGLNGKAFDFTQDRARLSLSDDGALDGYSQMTVSVFVNPETLAPEGRSDSYIVGKDVQGDGRVDTNSYSILLRDTGNGMATVNVGMTGQNGEEVNFASDAVVRAGEWSHIALTLDGETAQIHYNGDVVAQVAYAGTLNHAPRASLRLAGANGRNFDFMGQLDEFSLWACGAPAIQVAEMYMEMMNQE